MGAGDVNQKKKKKRLTFCTGLDEPVSPPLFSSLLCRLKRLCNILAIYLLILVCLAFNGVYYRDTM